jgi:hypothetical protein
MIYDLAIACNWLILGCRLILMKLFEILIMAFHRL